MLGGGVCIVNINKFWFNYDFLEVLCEYCFISFVCSVYQEDNGNLWMGIMGFGLVFYDMKQYIIVFYCFYFVLKNMGYILMVNDIIYCKRINELCFVIWDDGVWFYNVKVGKVYVINIVINLELSDICIYFLLEDLKGNLWLGICLGVFILDMELRFYFLNELVILINQVLF